MTARMSCRCGYDCRTESEDELVAVTNWHLAIEHPHQRRDDWLYTRPDFTPHQRPELTTPIAPGTTWR